MSVKLYNLVIKPKDGKIVIGEENKRGNLKTYIDISTPIIKAAIKALTTKPKTYIHQEISINNEIKHFKITCVEMSVEEVKSMKEQEKRDIEKSQKSFLHFNNLLLSSLGLNNIKFK